MSECLSEDFEPGGIVHVRLNRPSRRNALDGELMDAIAATFNRLSADPEVRVIVLSGNGGHFCAGVDLSWLEGMPADLRRETDRLVAAMEAVLNCSKMVISRVEGSAFAGGLALIAASDAAVAAHDARLALSEVKIGIAPALTTRILLDKLSPGDVRWLGVTGMVIDAHRAMQIGLVQAVAESPEHLDELVREQVSAAMHASPEAIAQFKKLMRELTNPAGLGTGTNVHSAFMEGRMRPSALAGIGAIRARRLPPWAPGAAS